MKVNRKMKLSLREMKTIMKPFFKSVFPEIMGDTKMTQKLTYCNQKNLN